MGAQGAPRHLIVIEDRIDDLLETFNSFLFFVRGFEFRILQHRNGSFPRGFYQIQRLAGAGDAAETNEKYSRHNNPIALAMMFHNVF